MFSSCRWCLFYELAALYICSSWVSLTPWINKSVDLCVHFTQARILCYIGSFRECFHVHSYETTLNTTSNLYLTLLFDILQVSIWRVQTWKAATWLVWIFVSPHWKMQTFRTVIYELQCWQEQILRYLFLFWPWPLFLYCLIRN